MNRVIAYLRVSTDRQENENQRYGIDKFCDQKGLYVTEYIEETISGAAKYEDRKLSSLLPTLKKGDTIIFTEISRISRKIFMTFGILQKCLEQGVTIYTVKEGYKLGEDIQSKVMATMWGLSSEMERNMLSQRIKESLARKKKEGKILGRRKGFYPGSKLDGKEQQVIDLLSQGKSKSHIAKTLKCHRHTVETFIKHNIDGKRETVSSEPTATPDK